MSALLSVVAFAPITVLLWVMDFTFFVVTPNDQQPAGEVVLIYDGLDLNFIDSAEAYCQQCFGLSLDCRDFVQQSLYAQNEIYLSLPYSETLLQLSGASVEDWKHLEANGGGVELF